MTRGHWLRLIKCEFLLEFLVLYDCKLNMFWFLSRKTEYNTHPLVFCEMLMSICSKNSIFKCRKSEDVTIMQSSVIATQISLMLRCFLCYCLALHADAQVLRWNASVMRDLLTVPNTDHFLKTKYKAEHMRKRVTDREGELQMNRGIISHPPTPRSNTDEEIGPGRLHKLRLTSAWYCWLSTSYKMTSKQSHVHTSTTLKQHHLAI